MGRQAARHGRRPGALRPANLYQRLAAGVTEQEAVCTALEESFLDFDGGGGTHGGEASEREVAEWVRRYREAKKVYYLRSREETAVGRGESRGGGANGQGAKKASVLRRCGC